MFSVLVACDGTAWEGDRVMEMVKHRFLEYSDGKEASVVSLDDPQSLKPLEQAQALLMYETSAEGENVALVRYGRLREIEIRDQTLAFRFDEEGILDRDVVWKHASALQLHDWEKDRTHWAVKEGAIPKALLTTLQKTYDVVFSFAGENRAYVEAVAKHLMSKRVKVFYDRNEEVELWGKDLVEHFDWVYRKSAKRCVMFISRHYVEKAWTRHERRSALERALNERQEYILPVRFDDAEVPGVRGTIGYLEVSKRTPRELGAIILEKLGWES